MAPWIDKSNAGATMGARKSSSNFRRRQEPGLCCAPVSAASAHQHVFELPGIAGVDVFGKQLAAVLERRPVGVAPDHRPEIGPLNLQTAAEVELVGLDDAAVGVLQHPYDAREPRRCTPHCGRLLVR